VVSTVTGELQLNATGLSTAALEALAVSVARLPVKVT
jgi:hypothetical protein